MNIPDAAIEAAGTAMCITNEPCSEHRLAARAAIEAAMPAIREAIAQEIEASIENTDDPPYAWGMDNAARIVRGGTR